MFFVKIWEKRFNYFTSDWKDDVIKIIIKKYTCPAFRTSKSSNQHEIILQIGFEDFMPIQIQVSLHNHLPALKNERSIKNIRRNIVVGIRQFSVLSYFVIKM